MHTVATILVDMDMEWLEAKSSTFTSAYRFAFFKNDRTLANDPVFMVAYSVINNAAILQ